MGRGHIADRRRTRWVDAGLTIGCAAAWVALLSSITTPIEDPDLSDGHNYLRMAQVPFLAYEGIPAPFAYRPGIPALVYLLTRALPFSAAEIFRILAHLGAVLVLVAAHAIAREAGGGRRSCLVAMSLAALSLFQVRIPLFFYSLIDVEAMAVTMLAMLLLWRGSPRACLGVAIPGLLIKEWAMVAVVVACLELARQSARRRALGPLIVVSIGAAAAAGVVAWPRLVVATPYSASFLDRIDSLESLVSYVGNWKRLANTAFVWAGYWLPTLMLLTRSRVRALRDALVGKRLESSVYCVLVLVFALVGGTNLMIFATYSLPIQAVLLARLLDREIAAWEILLVFAAVFVFNNVWAPIPELISTRQSLFEFVDFYGGWATRVTIKTGYRAIEIALFIALANAVRWLQGRKAQLPSTPSTSWPR